MLVLDVMMPGMDGYTLARHVRSRHGAVPILMLGVLAGLCVAIAAVLGLEKHIDSINAVNEEIISLAPDSLTRVSWTRDGSTLSFIKEDGVWRDEQDEAFPVDQDAMQELLARFETVQASFVIEDVEDYSQYGLDEPQCTITLSDGDGGTVVELGGYSTMDDKRYVTLGQGTVYLIDDDLLSYIPESRDGLMQQDGVPQYDTVEEIEISGASPLSIAYLPQEALSYTDAYEYYAVEGESYRALDTQKVTDFMQALQNLGYTDYATYQATEQSLEDYGLASPEMTVSVVYTLDEQEASFTLALGQDADGNGYVRMNDSEIIYRVGQEEYEAVLHTSYDTLRPAEVLALDWDKVEQIDITLDGQTYEVQAGSGYSIGEEEVDLEAVQSAVDALAVNTFLTDEPEKAQEIAFTVYLDGWQAPLEVTAYQYDGENCLVQLDGETLGLVERQLVVALKEAVNAVVLELE